MANKLYTGDVGIVFRVSTGTDLSAATLTKLKVQQPDGTEVNWTATVYGSAADGVLTYTSDSDDFPEDGNYKLQAYVEQTGGAKLYGETASFDVYDPYN